MINPLVHASSPGLLTPLPDFFAAQSLSRMDAFSAWGMMARFSRVSNNGGPFCLIFADGISAEEIVFQQLRGCQIDTERVDCIENLLLVLVRIQINEYKLGIHHDRHNIELNFVNMADKIIVCFNNSGLSLRIIYFSCRRGTCDQLKSWSWRRSLELSRAKSATTPPRAMCLYCKEAST